jgi:hypothetical protein
MAGDGAVLDFRGPLPDGDGIDDLTAGLSVDTRVPRAAYTPLGSKMLNQLLFQHSACLNEQAKGPLVGVNVPDFIVGRFWVTPEGRIDFSSQRATPCVNPNVAISGTQLHGQTVALSPSLPSGRTFSGSVQ